MRREPVRSRQQRPPDRLQKGCPMSGTSDEFSVTFRETRYDGYRSFSYLKPGVDYDEFALAKEFGRMPLYDLGLDEEQTARTVRLIDENVIISLHDHPQIYPADMG